jgi:hypothetical protein
MIPQSRFADQGAAVTQECNNVFRSGAIQMPRAFISL